MWTEENQYTARGTYLMRKNKRRTETTPLRHSTQVDTDKDTSSAATVNLHESASELTHKNDNTQHFYIAALCAICGMSPLHSFYFCCTDCIINGECSEFERIPNEFGDGGG